MIISIASGKGGTGKTLVAVNLAAAVAETGQTVHIADCDVEAPNDHLFLNPVIEKTSSVSLVVPKVIHAKCDLCNRCGDVCVYHAIGVFGKTVLVFPELCHACVGCIIACPSDAIEDTEIVTGRIDTGYSGSIQVTTGWLNIGETKAPPVIKAMKKEFMDDTLTIIDAPPGTSCPVVEAVKDSDYVVLVAEASPFGLHDLKLAVETVKKLELNFGVVINKADPSYPNILHYCIEENIHVLSEIPLDMDIARLYSRGLLLIDRLPGYKKLFIALYNTIRELVH